VGKAAKRHFLLSENCWGQEVRLSGPMEAKVVAHDRAHRDSGPSGGDAIDTNFSIAVVEYARSPTTTKSD